MIQRDTDQSDRRERIRRREESVKRTLFGDSVRVIVVVFSANPEVWLIHA